ncbi:MAG: BTAD domain-containing putative transcriptional regulator [Bacillota bacterium]|jgi:DNA-binding SARP family transcriptional activator/Tfp pilus assembly protein PilF
MIELRTLGVLDLTGPAEADCRAVLQQPKRLGLLAYLAVSAPRRFHRRDSLLAIFWPELDQDRARAALRRSLYFIRTALGPDVIEGRGEEEVGIGEGALWCDADAFTTAVEAGDPARALELYQGDLLEGFFVSAAPEYEHWLERERTRLRSQAAGAAWALADRAAERGDAAEAARYGRRAAAFDPDDEQGVRRLLALLDRVGDPAGALRVYDDFARRLAADYELQPSAETRAAVDAIRARPAPAAPLPISPDTIAVFPFTVHGDQSLAYLRDGMVDLLATELDGAGDLRTVDPRALLGHLAREGWRDNDPALAAGIAAHFGAGHFVLGSVTAGGDRLQATASLYGDGTTVRAAAQAAASDEAELFGLVDELARQLVAGHSAGPGARLTRLAALTTTSLPALKAYLKGEADLRSGRYFDAMDALQRAVAADRSFALAYYRLAAAAAGSAMPELARSVSDAGHEHRERLSAHDRLLLDAQRAWLHGAVSQAETLYGTITGSHPDDVEAWFLLGDLLFHSNPLRGRSAAEAREPFERALELEPDHVSALVHLARIAAIEGRTTDADDLAACALAAGPDADQALSLRALLAWLRGDRVAQAVVTEELQRARAVTVAVAFSDVALYSGDLAGADALARGFVQAARSDEMRALCHLLLAHVALARGDQVGAWSELGEAERLEPAAGLETRGLFSALPFVELNAAELEAARDALLHWDAEAVPPSGFFVFAMHNGLHRYIRLYLLALVEARRGDARASQAQADALSALPLPETGAELVAHLTRGARARAAWAAGDPAAALRELESGRSEAWFQLTVASPFYSQAFERFMRAELLRELGREAEAEGWYRSIAERSPYELIYRAESAARLR